MLVQNVSTSVQLQDGSYALSGSVNISDGGGLNINNEVASNNTSEALACVFKFAKLRSIFVLSNIAANVTFDGSANPALQMAAGVPFVWHDAMQLPNPFTNNVTTATVANNNATTNATINIKAIYDPT